MEAILTTVLAAALVAVLLLVFVAMPAALLLILIVKLCGLAAVGVDTARALREYWGVASRSPPP